jgi:IS5 family transposase
VPQVAIPRKGAPGAARQAHEHTRSFRRSAKWRTGSEGRISHLKHCHGGDRTLMDGIDGARSDPALRAQLYEELGIDGVYDPDRHAVHVQVEFGRRIGRVGGGT